MLAGEILGNICIAIICFPVCDFVNFEINLIFLIKHFCYMTKKSKQELKHLRMKRTFKVKLKAFFIIFKWLSVAKNCLTPESPPLSYETGFVSGKYVLTLVKENLRRHFFS